MPKRLLFALREHEIGLMYLALHGRKRCANCKQWILLSEDVCPHCKGTQFDRKKQAPKDKRRLLRSKFYRNYLAMRFGVMRGFRRGEIVGQRIEDAVCRCTKCRAYKLHKQGKTLDQIADALHKGLKETEFSIDETERYGEHKVEPLPGIRAEHFTYNAGNMQTHDATGNVTETVPYGTLLVYGKGWARGRSKPEEIRIFDPLRTEINDYIEANSLKGQDKLFPFTGRQFASIVKQAAVVAGTPHAKDVAPHTLRRSYATIAWRKMREKAQQEGVAADPRLLQEELRHADMSTTFRYTRLDKEESAAFMLDIFSKPSNPSKKQAPNSTSQERVKKRD